MFGLMTLGDCTRQSKRRHKMIKRQVSPVKSSLDRDGDSRHRTVTIRASRTTSCTGKGEDQLQRRIPCAVQQSTGM